MVLYNQHGKRFGLCLVQPINYLPHWLCLHLWFSLKSSKVGYGFALLPAVVMIVMPMTALGLMVQKFGIGTLLGGTAAGMFVMGFFLMITSWRSL